MLEKCNILKSVILCFFISYFLLCSVLLEQVSADNGKIAYSHVTDGYWQIWIMDTDGTNKKQVTHSHEDKRDPVWMEGVKLAYRTNNGALFIVHLKQQETREVFKTYQSINNPDYSSVHQRFVFVRFDPRFRDRSEIWTTNLDEKQAQILTRDKSLKYQPVFSVDGHTIAFVQSDKKDKMQHHIWTMDTDGKNLKQITSGKGFETHPSFSPDQKYISFTSNRNGTDYEIYTTTFAGDVQQITHNPGLDTNPCFSLDGQKIVFVSNRSGTQQIWMVDQDGSNLVALTDAETPSVDPAWGAWKE